MKILLDIKYITLTILLNTVLIGFFDMIKIYEIFSIIGGLSLNIFLACCYHLELYKLYEKIKENP